VKRLHLRIRGTVQGVWFRESVRQEAEIGGVSGWVRNNPDGSVEAVFEGHPLAVDRLAKWCRRGPDRAHVLDLEAADEEPQGEKGFRVIR
jgi:acylphosphatase